ncbi:MAG: hypothetical protein R3C15_00025 [Thermoleophilia bacterium]
MAAPDWDSLDLDALREQLRSTIDAPSAEKMIWAFDEALAAARLDDELLDYLLAAAVCLRAAAGGQTPRSVLESFFRRSVSDEEWRARYAPLLEV